MNERRKGWSRADGSWFGFFLKSQLKQTADFEIWGPKSENMGVGLNLLNMSNLGLKLWILTPDLQHSIMYLYPSSSVISSLGIVCLS